MAEKKVQIDIIIETANAARSVKSITDSIVELKDAMKTVGEGSDDFKKLDTKAKQLESSLEGVASAAKKTDTNSNKAGKSIGNLSLDIAKGIGIAKLFEAGIGGLTNAFSRNQQGADLLATASGALEIVLNEVVKVLFDSAEEVGKTSNGFQALGTLLKSTFLVIINSVKLAFLGIKLALQEVRLAWEESFFGDEDPATIKRLNEGIAATKLNIEETGKAIVDNGKKVVDNFIPAVTSVVDFTAKVIEGVSKISVTGAIEQSKANVQLQNTAKEAEAQAGILTAKYETQAEKLRQIRDDEFLSIDERKKANDDLAKVLDDQEKALLKQADAGVAAAQSQLKINNTSENRIALSKSLEAKERVLADIAGKRSEQLANVLALTREELELKELIAAGEVERAGIQKEFALSQEQNQLRQLELTRESIVVQRDEELKLLQDKINTYKEGTIARAEAEQEFLNKKQEFDNKVLETDNQLALKRKEIVNRDAVAEAERLVIQNKNDFDARQQLLDAQKQQVLTNVNLTEEERLKIEADYAEKSLQLQREKTQQGLEIAQAGLGSLNALNELFTNLENNRARGNEKLSLELQKKQFKRGKALAVAQTGINTATAIIKALADPGGFAGVALSVAAGISGAAQIGAILSKQFNPDSGGSTSPTSSPTPSISVPSSPTPSAQTPNSFALFGAGGNANNLGGGNQPQLVQAYVVESDISSVQRRVERFRTASEL